MGNVRRTDWLPVGGDDRGNEQIHVSVLSESDDSDQDFSMSEPDDEVGSSGNDDDTDEHDPQEPELLHMGLQNVDNAEHGNEAAGLF